MLNDDTFAAMYFFCRGFNAFSVYYKQPCVVHVLPQANSAFYPQRNEKRAAVRGDGGK